jgi:putative zinc finger protein
MTATEMTCLEVRDLLPEHAVGVLADPDRARVERHLRWCAGCRKESADLGNAAATFGFALAPVPEPQGMRDRVIDRLRRATGEPGTRRRARTAGTAIVAAFVAVASLGWGAVMAGRAERFEDRARTAEAQRIAALEQFQKILSATVPGTELRTSDTHLGQLTPTAQGQGGGAVLQLVSPRLLDFSIVIVNGLDPRASGRLPYRVQLVNADGRVLRAGAITALDDEGGADVYHQFDTRDLTGFTTVQVVDANGVVVLRGTVEQNA